MTQISETESVGDSTSLANIDGQAFTVIAVEDSPYTQQGEEDQAGIKITTEETFDIKGEEFSRFHTTRKAIVSKLTQSNVQALIEAGDLDAVKCEKCNFANGKSGFKLVDA